MAVDGLRKRFYELCTVVDQLIDREKLIQIHQDLSRTDIVPLTKVKRSNSSQEISNKEGKILPRIADQLYRHAQEIQKLQIGLSRLNHFEHLRKEIDEMKISIQTINRSIENLRMTIEDMKTQEEQNKIREFNMRIRKNLLTPFFAHMSNFNYK